MESCNTSTRSESVAVEVDAIATSIEARDCRNRRSPYSTSNQAPPCISHPSGTLQYQWHSAYDHLLDDTANRRNTFPILMGYDSRTKYANIDKYVMSYYDKHRRDYLSIDTDPAKSTQVMRDFRQLLIEYIGKERGDSAWCMKDDAVYVDLALQVCIRHSHATWLKRPAQTAELIVLKQGNTVQHNAEDVIVPARHVRDPSQPAAILKKRGKSLSGTSEDAITIDDDSDQATADKPRPRKRRCAVSSPTSSLSNVKPETASVQPTTNPGNAILSFQKQILHLRSENERLKALSPKITARETHSHQRTIELEMQRDQLLSDNAALGVALAGKTGIRKGSQAAAYHDLAARSSLTLDVTDRLLQNEEFLRKWGLVK